MRSQTSRVNLTGPRSSSRRRGLWKTLATCLLLTSLGCCSEPSLPESLQPPETLNLDQGLWDVPQDESGEVTLPYRHLRKILANRLRWVAYGKAKALVVRKEEDHGGDE